MLFNFQGPCRLVDSLFILAHRFFFVNTFLKLFLKFFVSALKNRFAMRFSGGLSSTLLDRSPERLNIISHPKPIVNTYFRFFWDFLFFHMCQQLSTDFPTIHLLFTPYSSIFLPVYIFSSIS